MPSMPRRVVGHDIARGMKIVYIIALDIGSGAGGAGPSTNLGATWGRASLRQRSCSAIGPGR
jgi:hypothetical protein